MSFTCFEIVKLVYYGFLLLMGASLAYAAVNEPGWQILVIPGVIICIIAIAKVLKIFSYAKLSPEEKSIKKAAEWAASEKKEFKQNWFANEGSRASAIKSLDISTDEVDEEYLSALEVSDSCLSITYLFFDQSRAYLYKRSHDMSNGDYRNTNNDTIDKSTINIFNVSDIQESISGKTSTITICTSSGEKFSFATNDKDMYMKIRNICKEKTKEKSE